MITIPKIIRHKVVREADKGGAGTALAVLDYGPFIYYQVYNYFESGRYMAGLRSQIFTDTAAAITHFEQEVEKRANPT